MHAILVPFGSHGDVHPFLGLGHALRSRGHRVTFVLPEYFGGLVRGLGFEMAAIGEDGAFESLMRDPDLWHPQRGLNVVMNGLSRHIGIAYPVIADLVTPGETVLVGGTLAVVVRVAQEALKIPAATVHLQPASIHSDHETPAYQGKTLPRWLPLAIRRAFFGWAFRTKVDPLVNPQVNALRAQLGLPPIRDLFRRGLHSPDLVLGFFPEWYASPQPDWPANTHLVGFPLYDERDATPMSPELLAFLDAGPPPIAFTPGSANVFGRDFFEAAAGACRILGRRGLLLTRHPDGQIPAELPDGVIHVPFAPFGQLLPRAAAIVHHGGIGTAAQGLASGIPQLIMPLSHDQFDNALRLKRLGVGDSLLPEKFRAAKVADVLRSLLDSPEVAARCRAVADRFRPEDRAMGRAADLVEALRPGAVGG